MYLLRAEVTGPTKDKLVPKIRQSAMILYGIYVALTLLQILLLLCTGVPLYDSVVNAFSTAGTGGFSVKNASIAAYANPAAEWIIAVFMMLFGINFNIYFLLLLRRFGKILRSEELRVYLLLTLGFTAIITCNTVSSASSAGDALRTAFFQVTSIFSTTGFATADYELWPMLSQSLIWLLLLFGACAGSTTGGLKLSRVIILVKNSFRELRHVLHPRSVNVVRFDGEAVPETTIRSVTNYFTIYLSLLIASTVLLSIGKTPLLTNLTASLTCLNNVGPGFGLVGPTENFGFFSNPAKLWLTIVMLVGRLEILPMLILFSPSVWKRKR
jgi:trk system potassium uptake protein TrkH